MRDEDWHESGRRTLGVRLAIGAVPTAAAGGASPPDEPQGEAPHAMTLMLLLNAAPEAVAFTLPTDLPGPWAALFDSACDDLVATSIADGRYELASRALAILDHGRSAVDEPPLVLYALKGRGERG